MNTPIYDFLQAYERSGILRLHMPGHKGKTTTRLGFAHDITEISGADSLFEASGIIAESEKIASELYHSAATCFSTGGSTLCIQTMLALMKQENRTVISVRNVHRSFISSCALLGIQPVWLFPDYTEGIISGNVNIETVEKLLKCHENACLYLTSPDYLGKIADIAAIAVLCHRYGARLLVDNAHGAHLIAMDMHPILLGADLCCDSAHKMLPSLTGGAYLHIADTIYANKAKTVMSLFGSTSPSYLIMASLDLCNEYIAEKLKKNVTALLPQLKTLRESISTRFEVYDGEPFHLTILCDGNDLARQLRKHNIECEYSDGGCIVLLFSPMNTAEDIQRVSDILTECTPTPPLYANRMVFPQPKKTVSIRKAVLGDSETVPISESLGRICAEVNVPCPPAIPIAVSGEIIDEECIKIFKRYGILSVNVLK